MSPNERNTRVSFQLINELLIHFLLHFVATSFPAQHDWHQFLNWIGDSNVWGAEPIHWVPRRIFILCELLTEVDRYPILPICGFSRLAWLISVSGPWWFQCLCTLYNLSSLWSFTARHWKSLLCSSVRLDLRFAPQIGALMVRCLYVWSLILDRAVGVLDNFGQNSTYW